MRSEIFAQIKKNKKQYYCELSKEKVQNSNSIKPHSESLSENFNRGKQSVSLNESTKRQSTKIYKRQNKSKQSDQHFLNHLIERLRNGYRNFNAELPRKIDRNYKVVNKQIHNLFSPVFAKLRNEYHKLTFAIGGRMELVSNYAIDNINNLGTVIFDVEDEQPGRVSNQSKKRIVENSENTYTTEWFSKILVALPEKFRMAITNLLIYLESDFLIFRVSKRQNEEWNKKTISYKPLKHRIKTLKLFSFSKKRVAADNTLQNNCVQNKPGANQNSNSTYLLQSFRRLINRYIFPLINKFL